MGALDSTVTRILGEIGGLAPVTLLVAVTVLFWDILLAGWMAARREAPKVFTQLTSTCGLLVAPAIVVAVATGTETGARTVSGISWLLPVVCIAFVLQVFYALAARLLSPVIALPILLYDLVVTAVVTGDYLVAQRGMAPIGLQAAVAARDAVVGMTVGRTALVSPLALLVPMIAPAYPARWRLSGLARALLVLAATAATTLLVIEWPRGIGAVRSYYSAYNEPMQARPQGDFLLGMRWLPVLDGPPPARAVRNDQALADEFEPDVLFLVLDEDGTRAAALDSLARVLEPLRADSTIIAIGLDQGRHPDPSVSAERAAAVERVLLRVQPDVIFPAVTDPFPSVLVSESPSVSWWRSMIRTVNAVRQRVRPATRLGISLAHLDARDSAIYAFATAPGSPVNVIGAMITPSFSGLPGADARLRAFERWHAQAEEREEVRSESESSDSTSVNSDAANVVHPGHRQPAHWLTEVVGLPHAHGDAAQLAAIRHALAWGSRRPWISAAIVGEPADYDGWNGMRASNGRLRLAWPSLSAAAKAMRAVRLGESRTSEARVGESRR